MGNVLYAAGGTKFNVRLVNKGDKYGFRNNATHTEDEPLVEFYDARYQHTEFGQFISRYNASTIIACRFNALRLDGGIPEWTVDREALGDVRDWLKTGVDKKYHTKGDDVFF